MSEQLLVSVIMNCYNGEKYLHDAVKSVIAQTYQNWELVFWDNKSTDQSAKIFKSFTDPRLKYYFASTHTSLYSARNEAIKKCKGEFISFLDVDDWWVENKIEKQMALFKDQEVGLVYSNYYLYKEKNKTKKLISKKKLPIGEATDSLLKNYSVGIITVVIRKKLFDEMKDGFNGKYNIIGDFDFVIRLSNVCKFACVQTPLAYYRLHNQNYSSINSELEIKELEDWVKKQETSGKSKPQFPVKNIKLMITYKKTISYILNNNLKEALKNIIFFPWGFQKIKLFVALLVTKKFLKRIRNIH